MFNQSLGDRMENNDVCVAIYKAPGLSLTREVLKQCFDKNPDGAGFAYVDAAGDMKIFKTMNFNEFADTYLPIQEQYVDNPMLVHFRIKTHGTKDIFNCHPFQVDENIAFIHNGIITKVPDCPDKKRSDTQMFNELILQELPDGWMENDAITDLIEEFIGYSKLVVLDRRDNAVKIYNEDKGTWKDGIWFSNMYWEENSRTWSNHLDNCLECNCRIVNNVFANTNNCSFCCEAHRKAWGTRYQYSHRRGQQCEYCMDSYTCITTWRNGKEYNFCSQFCKEKFFDVQDNKGAKVIPLLGYSQIETMEECTWCNEARYNIEMIQVDEYIHPYNVHEICVYCLDEAIGLGIIDETPELKKLIEDTEKLVEESYVGRKIHA